MVVFLINDQSQPESLQGSILGPLLLNVFINDVFQFNSASSEIYLYIDDIAIISNANSNSALQCVVDVFFIKYSA